MGFQSPVSVHEHLILKFLYFIALIATTRMQTDLALMLCPLLKVSLYWKGEILHSIVMKSIYRSNDLIHTWQALMILSHLQVYKK